MDHGFDRADQSGPGKPVGELGEEGIPFVCHDPAEDVVVSGLCESLRVDLQGLVDVDVPSGGECRPQTHRLLGSVDAVGDVVADLFVGEPASLIFLQKRVHADIISSRE